MIRYVKGDITDATESVIIHGCNAKGKMNSGVAKAIRAKWPLAFEIYENNYELWGLIPGSNIYAVCGDKTIVNAITQEKYGRDANVHYVDYDAIQLCLEDVRTYLDSYKIKSIAMPKIGAGLGNGDWEVIKTIIQDELQGIDVVVYCKD